MVVFYSFDPQQCSVVSIQKNITGCVDFCYCLHQLHSQLISWDMQCHADPPPPSARSARPPLRPLTMLTTPNEWVMRIYIFCARSLVILFLADILNVCLFAQLTLARRLLVGEQQEELLSEESVSTNTPPESVMCSRSSMRRLLLFIR